jgi:hypothetical protein
MGFRHTPFFNFVDTLKKPVCPFCRTVASAGRRYLETTLYEFVNDPKVRRQVAAARGFCQKHARVLIELIDPLGVALLHETLLLELADAQEKELFGAPKAHCPACQYAEEALVLSASILLDNFDEPEIQAYLAGQSRICLPHYRFLASRTKDKRILASLAQSARQRIRDLSARARAFAEVQNATAASAPQRDNVSDLVWIECIQFFSGYENTSHGELER